MQGSPARPWVRVLQRRLDGEAARFLRRDTDHHPSARAKAAVRSALSEALAAALDQEDPWGQVRVAIWSRSLPAVDAWCEVLDAEQCASLVLSSGRPFAVDLAAAARAHGPNAAMRSASEAMEAILAAGVGPRVRRSIESAMRTMLEAEDATVSMRSVIEQVHAAAAAMAAASWHAAMQLRGAVKVMDDRLETSLARLETQSHWLAESGDPWQHPGAFAVIEGLRKTAARRATLASCATRDIWDAADETERRQLLKIAERLKQGTDDAATHAMLSRMAERSATPPLLAAALAAIDWPRDPADRLLWTPPVGCHDVAGQLLAAMEDRRHYAIVRNMRLWRAACEEVEVAAAVLLGGLERRSQEGAAGGV